MKKEVQPKMLYCKACGIFSEPDHRLTCDVCGAKLMSCWWALLNRSCDGRAFSVKQYCDTCKNRFWCWTNSLDGGRIPTLTQARIVQKGRMI